MSPWSSGTEPHLLRRRIPPARRTPQKSTIVQPYQMTYASAASRQHRAPTQRRRCPRRRTTCWRSRRKPPPPSSKVCVNIWNFQILEHTHPNDFYDHFNDCSDALQHIGILQDAERASDTSRGCWCESWRYLIFWINKITNLSLLKYRKKLKLENNFIKF
jgi:hypothetical protein